MNDAAVLSRADADCRRAWSRGDGAHRHAGYAQASTRGAIAAEIELGPLPVAPPDFGRLGPLQPPCRSDKSNGSWASVGPVIDDSASAEPSNDANPRTNNDANASRLALPQQLALIKSWRGAHDRLVPSSKCRAPVAVRPALHEKRGSGVEYAAMISTWATSPSATTSIGALGTKAWQRSAENPLVHVPPLRQALVEVTPPKWTDGLLAQTATPYNMRTQMWNGVVVPSSPDKLLENLCTRTSTLATSTPYAIESQCGSPQAMSAIASGPAASRFLNDCFFALPRTSAQHAGAAVRQAAHKVFASQNASMPSTQARAEERPPPSLLQVSESASDTDGAREGLDEARLSQDSRSRPSSRRGVDEAAHTTQTHAFFSAPEGVENKVHFTGEPHVDFSHAMFDEVTGPFHRMLVSQQFEYEVLSTRLCATQAAALRRRQAEVRADYIARALANECTDGGRAAQASPDALSSVSHAPSKWGEASDCRDANTDHRWPSPAHDGKQSASHQRGASASPNAFARKRRTQDGAAYKDSLRRTFAAQVKLIHDKQNILKDKTDMLKDHINMVVQQNAGISQQNAELLTLLTKPVAPIAQESGEPNWNIQYGLDYIRLRWRGRGRIKTRHYWRSMGLIGLRICREMLLFGLNTLSFAIPIRLFDRR